MTLYLKNPGSDNQIIASVQGLIEECALVLGRERPVWQEQLAADESPSGLTTMPSHGFLRRRRSRSQADGEAEGQLLIICMREECGGHLRLLQQRLAESLKCEVVIGTDQVDLWRNEVARASRGVVLLQTKTVLRNPVRLLQLFEATLKCRPLVCVNMVGGGYDFEAAKSLLLSLPTPAATQLPDADMKTLRDELSQFGRCNLAELSSGLCHAVPNAISVFFHPEAGNTMLEAVVKDVLDKLKRDAELIESRVISNAESVASFHAQRGLSQVALVAATEEEPFGESMPEEAAPRRRKGSKTSMGIACQVAPEVEGGKQSDVVHPQPRSRKGSKTKMAMHLAETVGLVDQTPEMVEMASPGAMGDGGEKDVPMGGSSLAGRMYSI